MKNNKKDIENLRGKSPFPIDEMLSDEEPMNADFKALTIEVLKPLDLCSIAGAISVLDNAKKVLLNCTRIHSEYH